MVMVVETTQDGEAAEARESWQSNQWPRKLCSHSSPPACWWLLHADHRYTFCTDNKIEIDVLFIIYNKDDKEMRDHEGYFSLHKNTWKMASLGSDLVIFNASNFVNH
jgi:hypothetical protein